MPGTSLTLLQTCMVCACFIILYKKITKQMSPDSLFLNNRFYNHNTIWEYPCFKRVYAMLADHVNIESDNILYNREVHADINGFYFTMYNPMLNARTSEHKRRITQIVGEDGLYSIMKIVLDNCGCSYHDTHEFILASIHQHYQVC